MTDPRPPADDDALAALLRAALRDEAPPASVVERAVALRSPLRQLAGQAATVLRRLIAVAVPAPGGGPFAPAFGVRGIAPRQWLYRSDECEIDLRVVERGGQWAIVGQLFGALQAERVLLEGAQQAVAELGPTREFSFGALAPGSYRLVVPADEVEVVVPQIDVG